MCNTIEKPKKNLGESIRQRLKNLSEQRNRQRPIAFTAEFYDNKETLQRWNNFLAAMGKQQIKFEDVILELSKSTSGFFGEI